MTQEQSSSVTQPTALALTPPEPQLTLTPPDVLAPVVASQVAKAVRIPEAVQRQVSAQLDSFMEGILTANVQSDDFRTKIDQAFSLGRQEIAEATRLTNDFTRGNFVGETETPAYKAISGMRTLFDSLNPAKQGDLFGQKKLFGLVPYGDKLKSYLRRYESAEDQIGKLYEHVISAKDEVGRGVAELGNVRTRLWEGLTKLEAVEFFITELDARVTQQISVIRMTDSDRARALESELLYYVRQNVGDVLACKALTINAYNVAGELRKSGREVMNGCDRVATLGMSALSVAVTLARATGVQLKTMAMLTGAKQSIEELITSTGTALQDHVQKTTEFSANPLLGVQALQTMFDSTFAAMDTMDTFRGKALQAMEANNTMLRGQLTEHMKRITNDRQAASAADALTK
jgi:uncharacterized protein YaaN involved in tellurite resistance